MAVPRRFRPIVGGASAAAGALGVPGAFAFGADVPILIGIWTLGAVMIVDKAGATTTKAQLKAFVTSTISGAALFMAGSKLATAIFHLLPGPGTLAAMGVNSSLNALFTYRFLRSVAKVYDDYDGEEMVMRNLNSALSLFSVVGILSDASDMKDCICEGRHLVDAFRRA
jgi:hypothetical protein